MRTIDPPLSVPKLPTEIDGFDLIANGGLPRERVTLISGTSGSAKTVFAAQFLAAGISRAGDNGVFVTFEESPEDIRMSGNLRHVTLSELRELEESTPGERVGEADRRANQIG